MNSTERAACALVAVAAIGALSGCKIPGVGGSAKAPTGQVAATVGDQEITLRDLRAEMANANITDPKQLKQAQQSTLRQIIGRTVLAKAAVDQGVDKTPDFAIAKKRLLDGLLVQALQEKIASQVPGVTRDEAERYVAAHPDLFAERKILSIDYIRFARPSDPAIIKAMEPLKTLDQVDAQLTQEKIAHQRASGNLDSVGADPKMIESILKLPAGEVFLMPTGATLMANVIRDTKVVPFTGPQAVDYAQKMITHERVQESVSRQFNAIIAKAVPTVRFNKDYAAPVAPPSAAPAQAPGAQTPPAQTAPAAAPT